MHGNHKRLIAMLHDVGMAGASFALALYLRLGDEFGVFTKHYLWAGVALCMAAALLVFRQMKLYRGLWRYASMRDLSQIGKAVTILMVLFYLGLFMLTRLEGVPRSTPVIQWFLLVMLLGGPRFLYRRWKERRLGLKFSMDGADKIPVLLVGATDRAELFVRELERSAMSLFRPVGILDDRPAMKGSAMHGVKIYGDLAILNKVMEKLTRLGLRPQKLIITDDGLDGEVLQRLLRETETLGLPIARLPRATELKTGETDRLEVRAIAIEDLLGRPQTARDRDSMRAFVEGRRVLITGGGGTIGAELARQVAAFSPATLIIFEQSEFNLYSIERELGDKVQAVIGDVRDHGAIEALFKATRPEIVFHAAALKHVPIAEAHPPETALTNVFGTKEVADACLRHGAKAMVLISTDKAVNPSSVMGTTKRLAEAYCQAVSHAQENRTRFITVRFGNVLGSTGSVVPLFEEQLKKGGPITVTHPDIERYFMTVREAVELVIEAAALGATMEEQGPIFVLDMGKPVKIVELARQMIRLSGLRPDQDIQIAFTGLRPGEKMHEELFYDSEEHVRTTHESLFLAKQRAVDVAALHARLSALEQACKARDAKTVLALLAALVPEYKGQDVSLEKKVANR